jgi:hypothetical protein
MLLLKGGFWVGESSLSSWVRLGVSRYRELLGLALSYEEENGGKVGLCKTIVHGLRSGTEDQYKSSLTRGARKW